MTEEFGRTEVTMARSLGYGLSLLPLGLRLAVLTGAVLVGMAGCTGAWIQQQHYVPSPNVCRADEVGVRTDCIPRGQLAQDPTQLAGVIR
ncbi:hypothetical protein ACFXPS_05610 [Nocardia sp. NPDC059091]|uniref:hypothetical protein n=1 Tax=unclassified Nocardia TaxID=2637762 RepID=UPI0036C51C7D